MKRLIDSKLIRLARFVLKRRLHVQPAWGKDGWEVRTFSTVGGFVYDLRRWGYAVALYNLRELLQREGLIGSARHG